MDTAKHTYNSSYLDEISISGLFLRAKIPPYQKALALNFVTIRKIFSCVIIQPKVTRIEYQKLKERGFLPLEAVSRDKMCLELMKLIEFSNSKDKNLEKTAKEIFEIRTKELKYILSTAEKPRMGEFLDGCNVFIKYLEFIAG